MAQTPRRFRVKPIPHRHHATGKRKIRLSSRGTTWSVMVNWAVSERFSDPGRFRPGAGGCRGGVSGRLGAITSRVFSPFHLAISCSRSWMRSCWVQMISINCRTRGVSSASGMSGKAIGMAILFQLVSQFARFIEELLFCGTGESLNVRGVEPFVRENIFWGVFGVQRNGCAKRLTSNQGRQLTAQIHSIK